jgi:dihydroorotate dehydrogenase (fumarate)
LTNEIAGLRLAPALMNASGALCTTREELEGLGTSGAGALVIKSTTLQPRAGNDKPRFHLTGLGSINSMGLPNLGIDAYCKLVPELKRYGKPVIASIAGLQPADYPELARKYAEAGADAIEVNLSCPNLAGKPQIAYDFEMSDAILGQVKGIVGPVPMGVKLPPYFDPVFHAQMAAVIKRHKPAYVCCVNSPGHTVILDPEAEELVIKPKFGGLGGSYIKPIALGNVRRFHELLGGEVAVIGCGGIESGRDALEHFLAGASAVQIGTALMREGYGVFARVARELESLVRSKGARSVRELVGRAKERARQTDGQLDY